MHDLREHATDRHRVVDDVPFGGGPGMVLKAEPLFWAVAHIRAERGQPDAIILTSPDGRRLTQAVGYLDGGTTRAHVETTERPGSRCSP